MQTVVNQWLSEHALHSHKELVTVSKTWSLLTTREFVHLKTFFLCTTRYLKYRKALPSRNENTVQAQNGAKMRKTLWTDTGRKENIEKKKNRVQTKDVYCFLGADPKDAILYTPKVGRVFELQRKVLWFYCVDNEFGLQVSGEWQERRLGGLEAPVCRSVHLNCLGLPNGRKKRVKMSPYTNLVGKVSAIAWESDRKLGL